MNSIRVARLPVPRWRGGMVVWPLSLDQYHRMIAEGIVAEGAPIELLEGYLIGKDQGKGHARPQPNAMPDDPPRLRDVVEIWPLTLEQYLQMVRADILGEDDPVELWEGYLVAVDRGGGPGMPPGPEHSFSTNRVNCLMNQNLPGAWVVRCQDPIQIGPLTVAGAGSAPEPDVAIADGPDRLYIHHFPEAKNLRLVIEVADSSLLSDRRYKAQLYASAGIPLYWIVNIVDRQLEVHADPDPAVGQYRTQQILAADQQVALSWDGLAPVVFQVGDFLP